MKLLLADGTAVAVISYDKTSTMVNGNTVDAISITTEKTTLEKVKTLFGESDNLAVLHIYSDENILLDTFNGYQIRKSIALGETDTSFIVLLAKSSEVNEQLTQLSTELNAVKESITTLTNSISSITQALQTVNTNQEDNTKKFADQAKLIADLTSSVNGMRETDSDQTDAVSNLEIDFNKIKNSFNEFSAVAQGISESYNTIIDTVNTINRSTADAVSSVHNASIAMQSHNDSIEHLSTLVEELRQLATSNDTRVINYGETATVLTENVNSAKLAVENFEANLTTVAKNVRDMDAKVTETKSSIEEVSNSVTGLGANITSLEQSVSATSENVTGLTSRVTNLEPVTDYTKLSLADAKKFRSNESKEKLATYLEEHPIISTCHGGVAGRYSITSEKQNFLQAMISICVLAEQAGIEYQPSWNQVGEACTYDWTVAELQQLAIEIEATVRPLVSHQQALEKEILNVTNMAALQAVNISYDEIEPNTINMKETVES